VTNRRREQASPRVLDELLTPDEVCAILRVTKPWLYAQVQRRALPTVRFNGRSLRFKASDIQLYIDRQYSSSH
jgi:excisionase family DNA binding protein